MTEAIAETDEGRERAKAAEARIKEFRAGGREVESEVPAAKRARGSDESMEAEVPTVVRERLTSPWRTMRRNGWRRRSERRAGRT